MDGMDKFRGCLIGGAVGDALGFLVEFMSYSEIVDCYGENGIVEFDGDGLISDDTQMTLFTAEGLLHGLDVKNVWECYKDWYVTQSKEFGVHSGCRLLLIPELFSLRAPGNTCLSAIGNGVMGSIENPMNDSKGCGGVMRVAPVGLVSSNAMLAARIAATTHGHPLGYIPAYALAHMVHSIISDDFVSLLDVVHNMLISVQRDFEGNPFLEYFVNLIKRAVELSQMDMDDLDAIRLLGEGWVAEETLAIAVYCSLKYSNDFERAIIVSVNHDGDSDSTGAVTGNILGSFLGLNAIPKHFLERLELKDVIIQMADDLYSVI